jgi:hypothetical protein
MIVGAINKPHLQAAVYPPTILLKHLDLPVDGL